MRRLIAGLAAVLFWGAGQAYALPVDTVDWAAKGTNDGMGSGTLAGGTITVSYISQAGFNSGETIPEAWASYLGTAGAVPGGVTHQTGGVLGGAVTATLEIINFSAPVVNPILLVNYLGPDQGEKFNFVANSFTVLSIHDATANGNTITGVNDTDSPDDGFGLQFNGSFGPGNSLLFTYTTDGGGPDGLQTVGFTIGLPPATTPEPSTFVLMGGLGLGLFGYGYYRRKRAA
jgi:hypothetical protein